MIEPRQRYVLSVAVSDICSDFGTYLPDPKKRLSFQIDCQQELNNLIDKYG